MNWSTIIIILMFIINITFIGALIFIERKDPSTTWAWLLVINIFPIGGFFIYLLFGQNFTREKKFKRKLISDEKKKKYFNVKREQYKIDESIAENIDLVEMNYRNSNSMYTQLNDVDIYFDGNDKFKALLESIKGAKKYIHIEYYIFRRDRIGDEIINLLIEKLKEGVEVRLLVDAMGSSKINHRKKIQDYIDAGGKYAVFFPGLTAHINMRINYRDHRKIVVVDGKEGFLGGFNVGDEYLGRDKKIGYWRDTHFKIKGEAIRELEERFLLDWTYAADEDVTDLDKYLKVEENLESNVGMQIVSSGPDHEEQYIKNAYVKIINNAKKYVYLQSPYFVPDETLLQALRISALSGVDVRIMIPGNPDHVFMGWAASSYVSELLYVGVKVYYYNKGFLHAKTIVSDDTVCSIGTANMDIRSFKLNFETNAFIYNKNIAIDMKKRFNIDIEESHLISEEEYKNRSVWRKIAESIVRLLSPIL